MKEKISTIGNYLKTIGIVLIILKLFHLIQWNWLMVLLPLILLITVPILLFIIEIILRAIKK